MRIKQTKTGYTVFVDHKKDFWSLDETMAGILLTFIRAFRGRKQGVPYVDDDDVSDELRANCAEGHEEPLDTMILKYDYVLDEIEWALEYYHNVDEKTAHCYAGNNHMDIADDGTVTFTGTPPDIEELKRLQARADAGMQLFGKYFGTFWL